ncbi:translation initiation factor eIF-2B [Salinigranum halophilum]|jgi:translation initiation factor eIF-2B subunit delta|uniref:translation initiation factor eIF-2B n=1 Tax=Salinigranum halophilum TaxID=2565931 RepID=UPI00115F1EDD|nr:translation initiation factor eIF-2B [Salinigranum halophilum]
MIDETIEEIREMQTHSSSVVAIKATRALAELTEREYAAIDDFERAVEHNVGALRRSNPSHASLHNAMRRVLDEVVGQSTTVEGAMAALEHTIEDVVEDIEQGKRGAAANAAETFADGETFLTHDYSSTVLDAIETAAAAETELTAYITEARPRYLGRKTARALAQLDTVDPHLMTDGACGHFLPDCDRVVIGMDCIVEETLYNRVGTYPLVATANHAGVPVTVVGSSTKLIDEFRFENEVRPATEVMLEPAEGITVENPAYDATPVDLIDEVVTDEGVQKL